MPPAENLAPKPDKPKSPEVAAPKYDRVIFGHPWRQVDRDQVIAYYIALKSGLITADTPIDFTLPRPDDLQDPRTMVLEGFSVTAGTKKGIGNFSDDDSDPRNAKPAAVVLAQAEHRALYLNPETKPAFQDLLQWLTAVEKRDPDNNLDLKNLNLTTLNPENLRHFTDALYALQHYLNNDAEMAAKPLAEKQKDFFKNMIALLDAIVREGKEDLQIESKIQFMLTPFREERDQYRQKLEKAVNQKDRLQTVKTLTGVTLGYFDVRGVGNGEAGAFAIARQKTNADIVMIVDDARDDSGAETGRVVVKIKVFERPEDGDQTDKKKPNLEILAERLNQQEILFGNGYLETTLAGYGGHPGVIGSPQFTGSELAPESLWYALQNFYDSERFSLPAFAERVQKMAESLDTKNFDPQTIQFSSNPNKLAEREATFLIPNGMFELGQTTFTVTESDLPLYERVFAKLSDAWEKREIARAKNPISEPKQIVALREQRVVSELPSLLERQESTRALTLLDDLNSASVRSLPRELLTQLVINMSQDQDAIRQIWDESDLRHRITDARLDNHITPESEAYKMNRYKMSSLPFTVDSVIIPVVLEHALLPANHDQLLPLSEAVLAIILSPTYEDSHRSRGGYDSLLGNYLDFLVQLKPLNAEAAKLQAQKLIAEYGSHMAQHWQRIHEQKRKKMLAHFPGVFDALFAQVPAISESQVIEGAKNMTEWYVPDEEIIEFLSSRETPYLSIHVSIQRRVDGIVTSSSILTEEEDESENRIIDTQPQLHGAIFREGMLNIKAKEHIVFAEVIAERVMKLVKKYLEHYPHVKLRLLQNGWPQAVGQKVPGKIKEALDSAYAPDMAEDLKSRIVISNFIPPENQYVDDALSS